MPIIKTAWKNLPCSEKKKRLLVYSVQTKSNCSCSFRFDYTGHGASEGVQGEGTIGIWKKDVLFVLDELAEGPQVRISMCKLDCKCRNWVHSLCLCLCLPKRWHYTPTLSLWRLLHYSDVSQSLSSLFQILVGSSIGGWLMLLAAIARPEKISALVGISTAADHIVTSFNALPLEVICGSKSVIYPFAFYL